MFEIAFDLVEKDKDVNLFFEAVRKPYVTDFSQITLSSFWKRIAIVNVWDF